jgi:hypothetical protein
LLLTNVDLLHILQGSAAFEDSSIEN